MSLFGTTEGGFKGGRFGFLSNMYHHPFEHEGFLYTCSEVLYQYLKVSDDRHLQDCIRTSNNGFTAKRIASTSKTVYSDEHRIHCMQIALKAKFASREMQDKLLATSDIELVEYNTWNDKFWGVCKGEGLNTLGNMLMRLRTEIYIRRNPEEGL